VKKVTLLGHGEALAFRMLPAGLRVRLPSTDAPTRHAVALRIETENL
jgi:hypothetical protein